MVRFAEHILLSVLIAYPVLSLIEYMIHRHLMHRPTAAKIFGSKYLLETFREHAVIHHHDCYAVFDREPDPCATTNIKIWPGTSLMVIAAPCLVTLPVDALTAFVFLIGALMNGWIWSAIHSEMHRPSDAWFSTIGAYNFLKRWHFLHHRHPGTNFNTAFPMWDWFLGTIAVMTEEDRKEIEMDTWRVRPTLAETLGGSVAERL
jgi:hypothetical protein